MWCLAFRAGFYREDRERSKLLSVIPFAIDEGEGEQEECIRTVGIVELAPWASEGKFEEVGGVFYISPRANSYMDRTRKGSFAINPSKVT